MSAFHMLNTIGAFIHDAVHACDGVVAFTLSMSTSDVTGFGSADVAV